MSDYEAHRQLLTSQGQLALTEAMRLAQKDADFLAAFQRLETRFPRALARLAVEQAVLRARAAEKFSSAHKMYFTRAALEQSTHEAVAAYRAQQFADEKLVFDMGAGIGGDALALARHTHVIAVDRDPERLFFLRANAHSLGLAERITLVRADIEQPAWSLPSHCALYFDPARRDGQRRIHSVRDYQPSLQLIHTWMSPTRRICVKISPGVKLEELAAFNVDIDFISYKGALKEAMLWAGAGYEGRRKAVVLPGAHILVAGNEQPLPVQHVGAYLYEPDAAVLRAGLVRTLGHCLDAAQLHPEIAFLTADAIRPTPFAKIFKVEEVIHFGLKRIRKVLNARNVGRVTIKKRGSAIDVAQFTRQLRLKGDQEATLILTRTMEERVAILVTLLEHNSEDSAHKR